MITFFQAYPWQFSRVLPVVLHRYSTEENNTKLFNFSTFLVQGPNSYKKYGRFKGTASAEKSALSLLLFWANNYYV